MRIAFYAPMKPPDHPVPSGDRHMAQLFLEAFKQAGHRVELASRLRSRDAKGDPARQNRLKRLGEGLAERLLRRYDARPEGQRPQAWFTYHLYYKAPDWVGPKVCKCLDIPYLVAEASVAYKRAGGPWDLGHQATLDALAQSAAVITVNPHDAACLPDGITLEPIKPFLDISRLRLQAPEVQEAKRKLSSTFKLDPDQPWLLSVAMMRRGDKLASYRLLSKALTGLQDHPWQILIVGDGPAKQDVEQAFGSIDPARLRFLGEQPPEALREIYAASDLLVWPAVNEAYGMALLEAQASGLPVVAARTGGVPAIVEDGVTGLLTQPEDGNAIASAVAILLDQPERRISMASAAAQKAAMEHDLTAASQDLDAILQRALAAKPHGEIRL
ncbi:glycosyltransferase family 4 protein [Pelagibius sp. Alg239-R121]|uniref:glycosyltransferase family 4 protein n=1 Tax=Pelagibius sp. Alg239-R121 TaxID=2993448 RepID=UPI0024A7246D|nr:glycosyltransferase family 4 protein [Pelagibius sp. Alg239-R121]